MQKHVARNTVLLLGALTLLALPAAASHWQPGNGNPAARATQLHMNIFETGVFADDWSPLPAEAPGNEDDRPGTEQLDRALDDLDATEDQDQDQDQDRDTAEGTTDRPRVDTRNDDANGTMNATRNGTDDADDGDLGVCVIGEDSPCNAERYEDNATDDTRSEGDQFNDTINDTGSTGDSSSGDVNTDVSHARVHELWGGHPPWEGTQANEDVCFTHFHRDAFDETHCGWELDVEKPPENGDTATEDRTLTEPEPPESLGMEWISYPNSRDVMPNPLTAQDQPSALVCTILLNQDNEPITGHTIPDTRFAMEFNGVPYPEAHPATFTTPLTQNHDMIGTHPNMPEGDGWLDSECFEFANLEPGQFSYSRPQVTGTGADQVEFVGVTEHWDTQNVGEPYDGRVDPYGATELSDGQFSLDTSHDGRHIEVAYLFRLT